MSKQKRDFRSRLLEQIPISRHIPKRLQPLYFDLLNEFGYSKAPPDQQIVIDLIGWTYCKIKDVQDRRYCYGTRMDLPETGDKVITVASERDKQQELEMLPALQKQLLAYLAAYRDGQKTSQAAPHEAITKELSKYAHGYGVETID